MQYRFSECEIDTDLQELRVDGQIRPIEPQVFSLLAYLIENRNHVVSKDDLIDAVWAGRIVSDAALSSRISAARQAVGDNGQAQAVIRTVARRGFRFVASLDDSGGTAQTGAASASSGADPAPGQSGEDPADWSAPASQKPKLAVLPFDNISGDPDQAYLVDGITEDIITVLAKYRWLLVLARNATIAFRNRRLPARQIAEELNADYLVDGSVQRAGDLIRINVQLIDGNTGSQIWAERYDRHITNIFDLQDEITGTIAGRLEPELATAERQRAKRKPPQSLDAWDHYLLGLAQFYTFEKDGNEKAQTLFRKAIEIDPEFCQAYARLAYSIVLSMVYFDAKPDPVRLDEALRTARQALAIDEQDAEVRFTLGRIHLARGEYDEAIQELEAAVQLNPCLAVGYCGLGDALTYANRPADALIQFEQAIRLSPHDPYRWGFYSYRALTHLFLGEFETAAEWAEKATRTPNAQYWSNAHLAAALGHMDRAAEARAAVDGLLQRKPDFTCGFARSHLFYIKDKTQLETYIEGLRRAGVPE